MINNKIQGVKWILFDCMETIIDMKQLPKKEDYALWGFENSINKDLFLDFNSFYKYYCEGRKKIENENEKYYEFEFKELYKIAIQSNISNKDELLYNEIINEIHDKFWDMYKKQCYVHDDKRRILEKLKQSYKLGVVSNFKVHNGIEELLKKCNIYEYFEFVVTSIKVGYRKPHIKVFEEAILKTKDMVDNILFIGDDYNNDYLGAKEAGMNVLLYDPFDKYVGKENRIKNFNEILDWL